MATNTPNLSLVNPEKGKGEKYNLNLWTENNNKIDANAAAVSAQLADIEQDVVDHEGRIIDIETIMKSVEIKSWSDVQKIVRAGIADKVFTVGDQFVAKYAGVDRIWDVIGINHDEPADPQRVYSLTIQSRDCLMNCVFDASELLYFAEEVLPAGDYNFYDNYNSRNYAFSVAIPIPAGGSINVSVWGATNNPTSVQTKDAANVTIETIPVVESSEGTLIICNDLRRVRYGSNNYLEANIRSWLNSDTPVYAGTKKTKYDVLGAGAPYNGAGFLYNLDPELKSVVGPVKKQVAKNTITDGGGQDLFVDTAFLISRVEAFGGDEGVVTGEKPYEYYNLLGPVATAGELAGRIKYLSGTSRIWWVRSPGVGDSYNPRFVNTRGTISSNYADIAHGLAPACTIY